MRKVGIEISDGKQTICIFAGELDREEHWELNENTNKDNEQNGLEFNSTELNGITVEINEDTYTYTINNTNKLKASFINLETGLRLCECIPVYDLTNIQNNENISTVKRKINEITVNVLGETITIKKINLITFRNKKSIVKIIMEHQKMHY